MLLKKLLKKPTEQVVDNYVGPLSSNNIGKAETTQKEGRKKFYSALNDVLNKYKDDNKKSKKSPKEKAKEISVIKGTTILNAANKQITGVTKGYIQIDSYFAENNPYDNGAVNWEYWFVNLLFFNHSANWKDLIESGNNLEVSSLLKEHVNLEELNNILIELGDEDVNLTYIDNAGVRQTIKIASGYSFSEPMKIPLNKILVESKGVMYVKDENRKNTNVANVKSHTPKITQEETGNKVIFSDTLQVGHYAKSTNLDKSNIANVYAFATYNLWETNVKHLGLKYAEKNKINKDQFIPNISSVVGNPIGRNFTTFMGEWSGAKRSLADLDRLIGLNQSYRLLRALELEFSKIANLSVEEQTDEQKTQLEQYEKIHKWD